MNDEQLAHGLASLGAELPPDGPQQLRDYVALLMKWNQVYNLTALREPSHVLTHHLLDSLSVLPYIDVETIGDVGSGGGLPGIPLAIARPELQVALIEASHKKASFLQQVKIELGLENVTVVNQRVEQWRPAERLSAVISRALSDIADFIRLTRFAVGSGGCWYAMKGSRPDDELAQLPAGYRIAKLVTLDVPGLAAARHLVVIDQG